MIVPQFWAEARLRDEANGRQVTVRRFGWSDESPSDAQANADARAREALVRILSGERLPRRELKRAYNGSEGVPIREEIVERHGESIITRNSYGALCLNTPNVLFADIDFTDQPSMRLVALSMALLSVVALAIGWQLRVWQLAIAGVIAAVLAAYPIARAWTRLLLSLTGGPEQQARRRIARFLEKHPDWHLRLYLTPAGLRVLALHQTFDPNEAAVTECFHKLGVDPIYARMCRRQNCFRARVSPKPWRLGIGQHMRPRPGIWPVDPERMPERRRWIAEYEQAAQRYASCRFLEAVGSGKVDPAAREVQLLHDQHSQANRALEIA
jgi:hypothetical protein